MKFQWPVGRAAWKKLLERYAAVLLVVAVGAVLLLLPQGEESQPAPEAESESFQLEEFEEKLAKTISQIRGAGETRVVLTLQGGSRQVLAQDREQDGQGEVTTTTVTVGRGSGSQEVVTLQTVAPQFRGALVVCSGGGDPQVRLAVIQAVAALTGLGSDHISVCQSAA